MGVSIDGNKVDDVEAVGLRGALRANSWRCFTGP